jgi:hypothetical protein
LKTPSSAAVQRHGKDLKEMGVQMLLKKAMNTGPWTSNPADQSENANPDLVYMISYVMDLL